MNEDDQSERKAMRIYRRLLWLLPSDHRREYGRQMAQLFRDQYRDARHDALGDRRRFVRLWLETALDLTGSAFREHLTQQLQDMKNLPPRKLSLFLFIISTAAALLSIKLTTLHASPVLVNVLIALCAVTLLLRAVTEWFRPAQELIRSLLWGASIAIIYALIFPVFGKLHLTPKPPLALFLVAPMFLNGVVPLGRAAGRFLPPRT